MKPVRIGIIGFGTIGAGTADLLVNHSSLLTARLGFPLELARIADLDIKTPRKVSLPEGVLTTDAEKILADPSIDIVVELIGGIEPARGFILRALEAGKSVVTANKALLAKHGGEICAAAKAAGRDVAFEASVAGGIPILRSIREGLGGDRIRALYGIINGTCNYILSSMSNQGGNFDDTLREAQKLGYAEADPTFDIEGLDSAHKITILASLAFNRLVPFSQVYVEGISGIISLDLEFAKEFGYAVKLLGIAKETPAGHQIRVHPTMIPTGHLLAEVDGVDNAIVLKGDYIGSVLMTGPGAGAKPTATAVVGDVIDLARNIRFGKPGRVPALMIPNPSAESPVAPMDGLETAYYFRMFAVDRPGVLSKISGTLGEHSISIKSVIQKGRSLKEGVPIFLMTHLAREKDIQAAVKELNRLDVIVEPIYFIRVETDL